MMPIYNTDLNGTPETLVCLHWRTFPPWNKFTYPDKTPTDLWQEGAIGGNEYQQALTWARICNKFSMDEGCKDCEMVRKMGVHELKPAMMKLDGTDIVPTTDTPTFEVLPQNRNHLLQGRHTQMTRPEARKK